MMVWLKTLGICLIIGGFGVWGLNGARRFSRRAAQLKDLRMALGFWKRDYLHAYPLSRALERTARFAKPPVNTLFRVASLHLHNKEGATAAEAWLLGLQNLIKSGDLNKADLGILQAVAPQLGLSDATEQGKFSGSCKKIKNT